MSEKALGRIAENMETRSQYLDLSHCGIEGSLPMELAALTWLLELDLDSNNLYDQSSHSASNLHPPTNQRPSLQALAGLKALRKLELNHTFVTAIAPLAGLHHLERLSLANAPVRDIAPLARLGKLQELCLLGTAVVDITPLAGLKQLQMLWLDETAVADITPLAGLGKLRVLELKDTKVRNITALAGLDQLHSLSLCGTVVVDITPVKGLSQLQRLSCNYTAVANLSDAPISDIGPLKALIEEGLKVKSGEFDMYYEFSGIFVYDCPLTNPPKDVAERGNASILDFWATEAHRS